MEAAGAFGGSKEVVALLLEKVAKESVNFADKEGPSALHTGRDPLLKRPRARICSSGSRMRHL